MKIVTNEDETYTCTSCSAIVSRDAQSCPNCGEKLDGFAEETMSSTVTTSTTQEKKYFCPFCFGQHILSTTNCANKQLIIPPAYIRSQAEKVKTVLMLTIGNRGHGKTCFLSSFFHSLYHGAPTQKWPAFSFLALHREKEIRTDYVSPIQKNVLPPRTEWELEDPVILEFQGFYFARKLLGLHLPLSFLYKPGKLVTLFYDIAGEAFDSVASIQESVLPVLKNVKNLVFLIDLVETKERAQKENAGVVEYLHSLINVVYNALDHIGTVRKKGIIICFTKADIMWGEKAFGPLAQKSPLDFPEPNELLDYSMQLKSRSDVIAEFIRQQYPLFYNTLSTHFKPIRFASFSALGEEAREIKNQNGEIIRTVDRIKPSNVFDPFLWCLKMEGLF